MYLSSQHAALPEDRDWYIKHHPQIQAIRMLLAEAAIYLYGSMRAVQFTEIRDSGMRSPVKDVIEETTIRKDLFFLGYKALVDIPNESQDSLLPELRRLAQESFQYIETQLQSRNSYENLLRIDQLAYRLMRMAVILFTISNGIEDRFIRSLAQNADTPDE